MQLKEIVIVQALEQDPIVLGFLLNTNNKMRRVTILVYEALN